MCHNTKMMEEGPGQRGGLEFALMKCERAIKVDMNLHVVSLVLELKLHAPSILPAWRQPPSCVSSILPLR